MEGTITPQEITLLVQVGEVVVPVVTAGVEDIITFVKAHNGSFDVVAQLATDKATIAQDEKTVADEIKADAPPTDS